MIDPKVAGKILKEHFDTVTPGEFTKWYEKYVLKGRDVSYPESAACESPAVGDHNDANRLRSCACG